MRSARARRPTGSGWLLRLALGRCSCDRKLLPRHGLSEDPHALAAPPRGTRVPYPTPPHPTAQHLPAHPTLLYPSTRAAPARPRS